MKEILLHTRQTQNSLQQEVRGLNKAARLLKEARINL